MDPGLVISKSKGSKDVVFLPENSFLLEDLNEFPSLH